MPNIYEEIIAQENEERARRLRASLNIAVKANPDQAAQATVLSRGTGLPVDTVERNLSEVANVERVRQLQQLTAFSPVLASQLSNPQFAKMAHDSAGEMSMVERAARNLAAGVGGDVVGGTIHGLLGHNIKAGLTLVNSLWSSPGELPKGYSKSPFTGEVYKSSLYELADLADQYGQKIKDYMNELAPQNPETADQFLRAMGQVGGQIGTTLLSGGAGLITMIGQGSDQMADKIARDKISQQADERAQAFEVLSGGFITGLADWLSSKIMLSPPQVLALKNALAARVVNTLVGGGTEAIQETFENVGQDLVHIALTNPESEVGIKEAIEAGTIGGMVGTTVTAIIQSALHIRGRHFQAALSELNDASAAQKVRERDPATYQGYADAVAGHLASTTDGAVENLYIDANVFHQVMTAAQQDPAQVAAAMGIDPQVYEEAKVTGGDVVIPLSDYVGKVAGTEFGEPLGEHLRSAPDALSIAELAAVSEAAPDFQAKSEEFLAKQEDKKAWRQSVADVRDAIAEQIAATGVYRPAVARMQASFVSSMYANAAAEMGMTPSELYAMKPYKIVAGELGQGGMMQGQVNTATPEFKRWFGESKVVDEQGRPLTHYIGMPSEMQGESLRPNALGLIFTTPDTGEANTFAGNAAGANVLPVYVAAQNPFDPFNEEHLAKIGTYPEDNLWDSANVENADTIAKIKAAGFDGLYVKDRGAEKMNLAVFSPTQIKSVYNRGTFDPNDANILNQSGVPAWLAAAKGKDDAARKDLQTALVKFFGATRNPREAGYVLPDGTMLDLSGRHYAQDHPSLRNQRSVDHRELFGENNDGFSIEEFFPDGVSGSDAMAYVMAVSGAIRIDVASGVASSIGLPSQKQMTLLGNALKGEYLALSYINPETGKIVDETEIDNTTPLAVKRFYEQAQGKSDTTTFFQAGWHGTPHEVHKSPEGRFSTKYIGTGEGAQAYGYGLYFASSKDVAEYYRDALRHQAFDIAAEAKARGIDLNAAGRGELVRQVAANPDATPEQIARKIQYANIRARSIPLSDLAGLVRDYKDKGKGRLYKVELAPADDEYLLWDKPLSEQSEKVRAALAGDQVIAERRATVESRANIYTRPVEQVLDMDGDEIYGLFESKFRSDRAASEYLHSLGIRGIKYLDGTSRGKGEGNYNFVIFSDDDVEITEFWQKQQGNRRAGFDPANLTTILTQQSDLSSFLHETAHFFLTVYADLAASPNATARMQADMQTLLDWFGVKDLATWNAMTLEEQRKYHEQFAYNYEIYLFEGKAPSVKMQTVFDRFSAWLKKVYASIRDELNQIYRQEHGTDLPLLTGEVRQVMDRMLASDQQISQAEAVRGMAPIFQSQEEAGMDDAQWAAYQDMQKEAHEAALSEHTAASLRQMKWLEGAKSRALKALQAEAREAREKVKAEVTKEVENWPIYVAQRAMKEARKNNDYTGMLAVADALGYSSMEQLEASLKQAMPIKQAIRELTDQRMLEEHGELTDPQALGAAVDRAVHNEARARFIGVELKALSKTQRPVRVMQEAARQAARKILGSRAVKTLRPHEFAAAEARAAKAAEAALKKGDMATAIQQKEYQLLQNMLATEAMKAKAQVAEQLEEFKRVFVSDKILAKSRDMNYINTARAILAHYGLGRSEKPAAEYLAAIKTYDPEFYAEIEPMFVAHMEQAKPLTQLTLDEFTDLADQVQALLHLSRRTKQIEIDGQLMDRKQVVGELTQALNALPKKEIPTGKNREITEKEENRIELMGVRASLRRVEAWVDAMDKGNPNGVFRRYIWNPISDGVNAYRTARSKAMETYKNAIEEHQGLFNRPDVVATEIGYTFKPYELLHAILHTGNASNKRKLLLGRGWATLMEDGETLDTRQWDAFIARAWREKLITKEHYDYAQKVWDLMESFKPATQRAFKSMYGFYFAEITAEPIQTPWGSYAGGYVPAKVDPRIVARGAENVEKEMQSGDSVMVFPTTGRGATMKRADAYNQPLLLDIRSLGSHIDWAMRFSYLEPRIKDVARLVGTNNRKFTEAIRAFDPTVQGDMLVPWLQRTAMQMATLPAKGKGGRWLDKTAGNLRMVAGMQMIMGNVVNTVQQLTGLSIAKLKVKKGLTPALWQVLRQPAETAEYIMAKSDYMKSRIDSNQTDIQATVDKILLNPNKYEQAQAFAKKHGHFLQSVTQNLVDKVTWIGAYNQAIEQGRNERDAVREADSAVRMTQGSLNPEDISRMEATSAFIRLFSQFYNYFNAQANLLGTEFLNTARNFGVKKGMGKLFYIYVYGYMVPAVLTEIITQSFGGFDEGDDDEWGLLDAIKLFFNAQWRYGSAMLPGFGQIAASAINRFNDKPYDDRIAASPAVTVIDTGLSGAHDIYKLITDEAPWGRSSKDVLTGLGIVTKLPLGQLGKPVGYLADVAQGKTEPEGPMDVARGLVSGKDVNRKQ